MLQSNVKLVVYDDEDVCYTNRMMLYGFEINNKLFGTEYVIEDGKVTEIHYPGKIIKQHK